jgi:hypothetical protein
MYQYHNYSEGVMNSIYRIAFIVFFGINFCLGENPPSKKHNQSLNGENQVVAWVQRLLQGYDIKVWLSNKMTSGMQAWDASSSEEVPNGYGFEYPAGSGIEHLFGGGPRLGAIVDGVIRVDEAYNGYDARNEFIPEKKNVTREHFWRTSVNSNALDSIGYSGYYFNHGAIVNRKGVDDDDDGKIDEDELDGLDNDGDWNILTDDVGADGLPDSIEVSCNGRPFDPVTNPDPAADNYAPTVRDSCHQNADLSYPYKNDKFKYTEKNGIADHGEPNVDEDYGAVSDNDLYCSATDTFKSPIIFEHVKMGAKIIQKSYAWNTLATRAIVFMGYDFVNINITKSWNNAYIGYYADTDLGPISVSGYVNHNYSAYDSSTRTAYVHNPIDKGSTPFGLTILDTKRPFDSLKFIYQWMDFSTRVDPGTEDSTLYTWMDGSAFPGQPIAPNQSPDSCSDTRFLVSFGPYVQVNPGDTITTMYAFVSGMNVNEMLNNARRAHRIYQACGFVMPIASAFDSGNGTGVKIEWNDEVKSPYGIVTSYRIYYGTTSNIYTDSVMIPVTTNLSGDMILRAAGITNLVQDQNYYFAVAAVDDAGHTGALSDEMLIAPSVLPRAPDGLVVTNQDLEILIEWNNNIDLDTKGYNIYRASSTDSNFIKLNDSLLPLPMYIDQNVWGDKVYFYKITMVDNDDNESTYSDIISGRLKQPAPPSGLLLSPGKYFLKIQWDANVEGDLAGYNVYRSVDSLDGYEKLNTALLSGTMYIDSSIETGRTYYYYVEAVDTTEAQSDNPSILRGHTIAMDKGILVVDENPCFIKTQADAFYNYLLKNRADVTIKDMVQIRDSEAVYELGEYSTVLWLGPSGSCSDLYCGYPIGIRRYLNGGGHILITKAIFRSCLYSWYSFMTELFGADIIYQKRFIGSSGENGFPSLGIDSIKFNNYSYLFYVDSCIADPDAKIIYRFGQSPIGFSSKDSTMKAYYCGFPLFCLDTLSAQALIDKVLDDFGEVTGVGDPKASVPKRYNLYQNYPNPFNPVTIIQFDVPEVSDVSLVVYDVLGREVARLIDERKSPGHYEVSFDANRQASGVYYYQMVAGSFSTVKKMLLMK